MITIFLQNHITENCGEQVIEEKEVYAERGGVLEAQRERELTLHKRFKIAHRYR